VKYHIFSITHYQENISTCQLTNQTTWRYKQWTNEVFGIQLRQVFSPYSHDIYHFIGFLKNDKGKYEEASSKDFNAMVDISKTKLAQLL
jgi:hypothetical protein